MPLLPTASPFGAPLGDMGPQLPPELMGGMGPDPSMGMGMAPPQDPLSAALAARAQLDALIEMLMGPAVAEPAAVQPAPAVGGEAVGY